MRRILRAALLAPILALVGCGLFGKRPQAPATAEPPAPVEEPAVREEVGQAKTPAKSETAPAQPPPAIATLTPDSYEKAKALHLRALAGTAGGGLGAGDVGYYLDVLYARLRQALGGVAIEIERTGRGDIVLRMAGNAVFESNRSQFNAGALELLAAIAKVVDEYRLTLVTVHGHTDDVGEAAFNLRLSEQRALSVARYLADAGVARARLLVVGHGESEPVADNATQAGRDRNRRVELQLEPIMP